MISSARTDLQIGAYDRAEARLTRLIDLWPEAPETPEARYLLGETRFVTRDWVPATEAYVGYLRAAPQGPRTPEVLLRLASTFRELGDARQRCLALERFNRAAPNPTPALRARYEAEAARATCPAPAPAAR
jgi:TolA-binding protein